MSSQPFLERLSAEDRTDLDAQFTKEKFKKNKQIVSHQDQSSDVFFVLDGTARATIYSAGGKEIDFRDISSGEIFGDWAAIDDAPRSASVVAKTAVTAGRLPRSRFVELIDQNPGFRWAILQHMSSQCRNMTNRIFEYSTLAVRNRVFAELIRMGEALSTDGKTAKIEKVPTHQAIASRISSHREAVSRDLSLLHKTDIVRKVEKSGWLIDLDRLRDLQTDDV